MPLFSSTQPLTLAELTAALRSRDALRLPAEAAQHIAASHDYLHHRLQALPSHLFGRLPDAGLPPAEQTQWQANLLMSHAAGACPEVPTALVRRMLLLKVHSLSQGHSGAAPATVRRLLDFYDAKLQAPPKPETAATP